MGAYQAGYFVGVPYKRSILAPPRPPPPPTQLQAEMAWVVGVLVVKFLHRQKCEIEPVSTAQLKSETNGKGVGTQQAYMVKGRQGSIKAAQVHRQPAGARGALYWGRRTLVGLTSLPATRSL